MKNGWTVGTLIFCVFTLSACHTVFGDRGVFHDRANEYRYSHNGKKLIVPPPLSSEKLSRIFIIPDGGAKGSETPPPPQ